MCGIVGAVAQRDIIAILLEGLKRLEYRGYDSAGLAILNKNDTLERLRIKGKVKDLVNLVNDHPLFGMTGIAHTRWATHGTPSENNAHPHLSHNQIALVHNGIIENYENLREGINLKGYQCQSDTDSEVVAHLLHFYLVEHGDLLMAVRLTIAELEGAFALGIIHAGEPNRMIAVRYHSPLVIGLGVGENFIASDSLALLPVTQRFIYLEEGDIADLRPEEITIYDFEGNIVERKIHQLERNYHTVERGKYRHFMQKEIFEQPEAIAATLESRLGKARVLEAALGAKASVLFDRIERVTIVACGTSYHAGMIARYWLEEIAGVPCQVDFASEYRYRHVVVAPGTLFVAISQSGETADTLAALRLAKNQGYLATLGICNMPESSLMRESDLVLMTRAGIEIGVASTKAFTTQLTTLLMLTIVLGRRHSLTEAQEGQLVTELLGLPKQVAAVLAINDSIKVLAKRFTDKEHVLFLGRGSQYPVALEGALKLKELSYIHAEAYPAGELKHGPLALVDKNMPVVAIAPNDELLEKLKSNLQEVQARGGELIVFADSGAHLSNGANVQIFTMPTVHKAIAPIIYTIPLQLLAYHVAVIKGTDVDQPRNLAKSVTVE
jgi:glucosamine--fructose-6-phosphate aminotransferase (isomerizing)